MTDLIVIDVVAKVGFGSIDSAIIYKSQTPFTHDTLPTPLAVLPQGVTTYTDADVIEGTTYYYCIEVVKDHLNSRSEIYTAVAGAIPSTPLIIAPYPVSTQMSFFNAIDGTYVNSGYDFPAAFTVLGVIPDGRMYVYSNGKLYFMTKHGFPIWDLTVAIVLGNNQYGCDDIGSLYFISNFKLNRVTTEKELWTSTQADYHSMCVGLTYVLASSYYVGTSDVYDRNMTKLRTLTGTPTNGHVYDYKSFYDNENVATSNASSSSTVYIVNVVTGELTESISIPSYAYYTLRLPNNELFVSNNSGCYIVSEDRQTKTKLTGTACTYARLFSDQQIMTFNISHKPIALVNFVTKTLTAVSGDGLTKTTGWLQNPVTKDLLLVPMVQ